MKIVLTNDDGIGAPGLEALKRACAGLGELFIVAPALEQSGVGHSLTTLETIAVSSDGGGLVGVHGTPADCARLALLEIVPGADLLISGINRGGNLGADVYTSGTVAAAREAALHGVASIALSQYVHRERELDWELVSDRVSRLLKELRRRELPPRSFLNVNLPHPPHTGVGLDLVSCPLDPGPLEVRYERNGHGFRFRGDYARRPRTPGCDVDVCFGGGVAVTTIRLEQGI